MSTINDRAINLLAQLALATDGAVAGIALACLAIHSWRRYNSTSSALHKIRHARTVPISDLRSLVAEPSSSSNDASCSASDDENLVVVRGFVQAKSVIDGNWHSLRPNVLVSYHSGAKGVVLQKVQTCIYNDSKGLFGWISTDFRTIILGKSLRIPKSMSLRTVPFVLVGDESQSDYLVVNMDGSTQPLPLTTVYHHLERVPSSPFTFLQALMGHAYPIGLLDEEKLLPLGKEISAVGTCTSHNGYPQIKACKDLPYFLSDLTKDQMLVDLTYKGNVLFWSGIVFGTVSLGILSYAFAKNWRRWRAWMERRRLQLSRNNGVADTGTTVDIGANEESEDIGADEENEEIPEGQLCVICLMRRKRSAFVPCGHFVCCHICALAVERETAPKCPLCRQTIRSSVRIYDS